MAARYRIQMFKTPAEALTLGGKELAADGVLLIGEHGDYPTNEKGQKLYPRRRLFEEIVKVFGGRDVAFRSSTTSTFRIRGTMRNGCTANRAN